MCVKRTTQVRKIDHVLGEGSRRSNAYRNTFLYRLVCRREAGNFVFPTSRVHHPTFPSHHVISPTFLEPFLNVAEVFSPFPFFLSGKEKNSRLIINVDRSHFTSSKRVRKLTLMNISEDICRRGVVVSMHV